MKKNLLIGALVLLGAMSTSATANVITATNTPAGRATFGGNDLVTWTTLGPDQTTTTNPFSIASANGVSLTVSEAAGTFQRRTLGTSWGGNFTDGSDLLWNQGNGQVTIAFGSLIQGIGFQINPNFADTSTTVSIFGAGNVLFQTITLLTNDRSQPSADFIGFVSNLQDIASITINQSHANTPNADFAINQLSLIDGPRVVSVPEPGTLALLGLGLLGLALRRRSLR